MAEGGFRFGLLIGGLVAAVVGLVVALVLTSGDDGEATDTTTVVSTTTVTKTKPADDSNQTTTTPPLGEADFSSPSGNILCHMSSTSAACSVTELTYEPPPMPADCDLPGWGHVVSVESGSGGFVCADNAPASPDSPTLGYGESLEVGPFSCESSESGVACINRDTGHGFRIARERVDLY